MSLFLKFFILFYPSLERLGLVDLARQNQFYNKAHMHDFALDVHNCAYFCCYTDFAAVLTCGHQGLQINREKNWSMDKELRFIIISYSFCSCADVQSAQGTNYLGNHFTGLFTHLSCCCWSAWTPAAVMTLWEYK